MLIKSKQPQQKQQTQETKVVNSDEKGSLEDLDNLMIKHPTEQIEDNVKKLSSDEIYNSLKEAYLFARENELEISFTSPGWIKSDLLREMNMVVPSCGACLSNMAIAPNGEVIPCQSWLFEDGLGNILNTDFKKIWNSKKCKNQRKFAVKNLEVCALKEARR